MMERKSYTIEEVRAMSAKKDKSKKKSRAEWFDEFMMTPAAVEQSSEEKEVQRSLFERHDSVSVAMRLPLAPSVNHYKAIFQPKGCVARLVTSAKGRAYCDAVSAFWKRHNRGWTPEPLTGRLRLLVTVHMARNGSSDLDNRVKPLQDAMKLAGMIEDDANIDDLRVMRGSVLAPVGAIDVVIETIL
jgi:Holliday junction resolvase RusA-like endonuclease